MQYLSKITNLVGRAPKSVLFSIFLILFGTYLLISQSSFVHPGPAIGAFVLAGIFLIEWRFRVPEPETLPPADLPVIIGLDVLAERWIRFKGELSRADRKNLFRQVESIQKVFSGDNREVTIVEVFPGNKPEKGALLVKPNNGALRVVKFDRVENMKIEAKKYSTCIAPRLNQQPGEPVAYWPPEAEWASADGQRASGVVVYKVANLHARSPLTFAQLYRQEDTQAVFRALEKIVEVMGSVWEDPIAINQPAGNCPRPNHTLYGEYRRLSDANKLRRMQESGMEEIGRLHIMQFEENQQKVRLQPGNQEPVELYNPLRWVREVFGRRSAFAEKFGHLDQAIHRRDSIVHGDFHAGNVLIEGGQGEPVVWLIDFPHTHVGPTVQDIARLEVDIKFSLFPEKLIESDLATIYAVEKSILGDGSRRSLILINDPEAHVGTVTGDVGVELTKMVRCLAILRRPHRHLYLTGDAVPYYLALLHATMPMLYYVDRSPWQKLYAFVSAALLCELLDALAAT